MYGQAQRYLRLAAVFRFDKHSLVVSTKESTIFIPLMPTATVVFFSGTAFFIGGNSVRNLIYPDLLCLEPLNDA